MWPVIVTSSVPAGSRTSIFRFVSWDLALVMFCESEIRLQNLMCKHYPCSAAATCFSHEV